MSILRKNTILILSFALFGSLIIFTHSYLIHITLLVILMSITVALHNSSPHKNQMELLRILDEIEELLEFQRNKINVNEHADDEVEKNLNKVLKKYEQTILEETQVAGEMILLAEKVARGHYGYRITSDTKTPYMRVLRNSMNDMLESSEKNLDAAIATLKQYSNGIFDKRIVINAEEKMAELLENINILGESLENIQEQNKDAQQIAAKNSSELQNSISVNAEINELIELLKQLTK